MAWTNISNALVAVGAKPFATTMQALRDNIVALALGETGAPSVLPNIGVNVIAGEIGSYVFARSTGGDVSFGLTVAGSSLRPTSAARSVGGQGAAATAYLAEGSSLSGTWRCMGAFDAATSGNDGEGGSITLTGATLWVRIA